MYKLPYFTETDHEVVFSFMKENPFVLIAGFGTDYPVATQVPVEVTRDENGIIKIVGHIMRGTDHHKAFRNNDHVLLVFSGPHCYVSASWYKKQDVASTWNYIAVHVKGRIRFLEETETLEVIKNITLKYEDDSDSHTLLEHMPEEYVNHLVKAIVGFEIIAEDIDNVFKLSQNHDAVDRQSIIQHLKTRGDYFSSQIAREMENRM